MIYTTFSSLKLRLRGAQMKYEQVWNAVDKLAKSKGLSPSGLAKLAGLDATTFNKSKRLRPDGNKRWPSLESINKILEVCNLSFDDFYNLGEISCDNNDDTQNLIPFIKLSQLNSKNNFSDKNIDTSTWKKIIFPDAKDVLYAIEMDSNKYHPIFRDGTVILASVNSDIRKGDRVVVYKKDYSVEFYEFIRRTSTSLIFKPLLHENENIEISIGGITLLHRIIWAGQ